MGDKPIVIDGDRFEALLHAVNGNAEEAWKSMALALERENRELLSILERWRVAENKWPYGGPPLAEYQAIWTDTLAALARSAAKRGDGA